MAASQAQVEDVVRSVLSDRLRNVGIVSIDVRPGVDPDGDRVLFITVVFDDRAEHLDSRETSSLARRLLPKMQAVGEEGFPIFSFIAESELKKAKAETGRSPRRSH